MALLSLQNISLNFGHGLLLDGVNLQLQRGERVCLLGRNGAGKSTLLRLLSGELPVEAGKVALQQGARVARLPQEVPAEVAGSIFDVVADGWTPGEDAPAHRVEAVISRLKLDPQKPFATLSGGLKRRAWLGRTLVAEPDVLLLDEPTNHLDIGSIEWLEEFLLRSAKTLLFVTHDRMLLRRLATRIVEIDRGSLLNWDCDYDTYLVRKDAALQAETQQRATFDKLLAREEVWVRRGVEARRTKSLSRIRALEVMRAERMRRREQPGMVRLRLQDASRSGRLVCEMENVSFSYDTHGSLATAVVRDLSTVIMRGDKIGIIGPNGSGKSTLLGLLLGRLEAQSGTVSLGTRLQVAYFDQLRAQINDELTVQQNVCGDNSTVTFNGEARHIVGYLQEFLFSPERSRVTAGVLSGGERNRLLLAKLFTQPANVLVLDEPTNDLDVETLDLLEELLVEFKGTLLIVSHDRAFLNNVVTSTLVFEPANLGGHDIKEYVGGYDDWLRQRPRPTVPTVPASLKVRPKSITVKAGPNLRQQKELESLPARIEALEAEQQQLADQMSEAQFYSGGGDATAPAVARLAAIQLELSGAFARWDELLQLESTSVPKAEMKLAR